MRRLARLSLLFLLAVCPILGFGSNESQETAVQVAWGWVRQKDGTRRDISGMVFPAKIHKVKARRISKAEYARREINRQLQATAFGRTIRRIKDPIFGGGNRMGVLSNTTVYQNVSMNAQNQAEISILDPAEFLDPSSLDDLTTTGAAGIPIKHLTFGLYIFTDTSIGLLAPPFFFVNWQGHSTYNAAAAPTENAFGGVFVDFAVSLVSGVNYPSDGGPIAMTIDVSSAGAVSPSNTMYLSQQHWRDNEVNFETQVYNAYTSNQAPTIGTSMNQFWYDADPLDNIFTNGEIDVLSGEGSFSNHLRTLTVDGTIETLSALAWTPIRGREWTGGLIEVGASDDTYLTMRPNLVWQNSVPPIQFEFEGISSGTTANNFKFTAETSTSGGAGTLRLYLYNFATDTYELLSTSAVGATDQTTTIEVTSNAARFIAPSGHATPRRVKSKVAFSPGGAITAGWRGRVDKVGWTITR